MYSVSVIIILFIMSFLFSAVLLIAGNIFPSETIKSEIKLQNYESGITSDSEVRKAFKPAFFTYALLFMVYDAEILLLFPFALAFGTLKSFVFLQAIIFILILILSLSYAVQKNLLRFK